MQSTRLAAIFAVAALAVVFWQNDGATEDAHRGASRPMEMDADAAKMRRPGVAPSTALHAAPTGVHEAQAMKEHKRGNDASQPTGQFDDTKLKQKLKQEKEEKEKEKETEKEKGKR